MSDRVRVSSNLRNDGGIWRYWFNPEHPLDNPVYYEIPDGFPVSTWYRKISDQSGPHVRQWDPIPGKRAVKPVTYLDYRATDAWWKDFIGHHYSPVIILEPHRVPLWPELLTGCVPFLPEGPIHEFGYECFLAFDTQIKEEIQPLDFLSSLTEAGKLIPKFTGSIIRDASGAILTHEFGWKQFWQDVGHISNLVEETRAKLQDLRDTWGKEQHLVRSKTFFQVQPEQQDEVYLELTAGYGFRYTLKEYKLKLTCGTYRFHMLKDLDSTLSFLRAAAVALGLGSPIKAIWDAIPGSFLLEWLTNIGQFFRGTTLRHLFQGPWELRHPCISQRVKATVVISQDNHSDVYQMPSQLVEVGTVVVTRYERRFGFPTRVIRNKILELTPKQLLLLGAMGTSKGSASW